MRSAVVTGAGGFIGRVVCRDLVEQGFSVQAVSRRSGYFVPGCETVVVDDYRHTPATEGAVCIHLAANNNIQAVQNHPAEVLAESLAVAEALLAKPFEKIIYVSSTAVYGDQVSTPHTEASPTLPFNRYSEIKLATEKLFAGGRHVVARPSNIYGVGMSLENVVSDILKQIPQAGPLTVRNAAAVRDYLHVTDLARGLSMMARAENISGLFNLSSGLAVSVEHFIARTLALTDQSDRPVVSQSRTPSILTVDSTKMRNVYGWQPRKSLDAGIRELLEVQS